MFINIWVLLKILILQFKFNYFLLFHHLSDGKLLITGSKNNYFHVWDINKKELIKKIDFHQNPDLVRNIKDCCVLHGSFYENKILVVLTQEGFLEFYNLDNGENLKTSFDNHNENKINQMFCSPNSRYLCCITQNGLVECYDLDYLNIKLNSKNQQQTNGINMKDESYSIKTRSEIVSKVDFFFLVINYMLFLN